MRTEREQRQKQRMVGHIDMDAFFAAIEEHYNPRWRGMPIVVGADPRRGHGRGVVSTANYAARRFGIHSAMPVGRAWQLAETGRAQGAPETIFLSGHFGLYSDVSRRIMALLEQRTPILQQCGVDEAYLELSHLSSWEAAEQECRTIKQDIHKQEGLTASIGLAPNKLVAKIASDYDKPDGLVVVRPEAVLDFLGPLPIRVIPGVGPKTALRLRRYGIATVSDVRSFSKTQLQELLGSWGDSIYRKVRGISDSPVSAEAARAKSMGKHITLARDSRDPATIINKCTDACDRLISTLFEDGFQSFRTVVVTVRFANFVTQTRSHTMPKAASSAAVLKREALRLLLPFLDRRENPHGYPIRLIGVRMEKLS